MVMEIWLSLAISLIEVFLQEGKHLKANGLPLHKILINITSGYGFPDGMLAFRTTFTNHENYGQMIFLKLSQNKIGLNLSQGKSSNYYSSDRIAQLIGNGLLTFIDKKTFLSDFSNDEMVFYNDIDDLSYKINKYKKDIKTGKKY